MEDNPCCQSIIQTFLIVFNIITFLVSGGILGFSIYSLVDGGFNRSVLPDGLPDAVGDLLFDDSGKTLHTPVILLITVSALVLIVSFLGCIGTWQQSRCLIAMYTIVQIIFLAFLFGGTCWIFLGDPEGPIGKGMKLSLDRYEKDNSTTLLWDKVQIRLSCCGVYSVDDWVKIMEDSSCLAPYSCKEFANSTMVPPDNSSVILPCLKTMKEPHHSLGCLPALKDALSHYKSIMGGIMMAVWVVVIINLLFSFALCVVLDYVEYTYK